MLIKRGRATWEGQCYVRDVIRSDGLLGHQHYESARSLWSDEGVFSCRSLFFIGSRTYHGRVFTEAKSTTAALMTEGRGVLGTPIKRHDWHFFFFVSPKKSGSDTPLLAYYC